MPDTAQLRGVGVGTGRAAGPVVRWLPAFDGVPEEAPAGTPEEEAARVAAALEATAADLERRAGEATGPAGEIVGAVALMARDPVLRQDVEQRVARGVSAERAVWDAMEVYRDMLESAGDYLAARAPDVCDVRNRVLARLRGRIPDRSLDGPGPPPVLVAADLAPADTAGLDVDRVAAFVTEAGGPTSHTAIIARAAGIPAVVACPGAMSLPAGADVLVDAAAGTVDPLPEAASVRAAQASRARRHAPQATVNAGVHPVELLANVGAPAEAVAAREAGAQGVGLLRTELCFLGRPDPPSVDEQATAYRRVFEAFAGAKVVVRTLDAGADKPLPFLGLPGEANPALGVRGLRAHRCRPELLDAQLEAIARAADGSGATVWVMAPMVADVADARWFRERAAGLAVAAVGVMVEVPSAALLAGEVLDIVDFASVGTNDLAQYALAADRQTAGLAPYQDPWHPGMLRLVRMTAEAGGAAPRPIGVCGEAAADPLLACVLVGLGVDSLSMTPGGLAEVSAALTETSPSRCREMAGAALAAADAAEARAAAAALAARSSAVGGARGG